MFSLQGHVILYVAFNSFHNKTYACMPFSNMEYQYRNNIVIQYGVYNDTYLHHLNHYDEVSDHFCDLRIFYIPNSNYEIYRVKELIL